MRWSRFIRIVETEGQMVEEGCLWVGDIGDIGDDVLAKEECQDDAGDKLVPKSRTHF